MLFPKLDRASTLNPKPKATQSAQHTSNTLASTPHLELWYFSEKGHLSNNLPRPQQAITACASCMLPPHRHIIQQG